MNEPGPQTPAALAPAWAVAVVFVASACTLVLEIVAGRLLAPIIGESLETYTAVIGTVLAGIAAGNAVGGRLADRGDPTRLLGPLLVLGGATSWLAPLVAGIFDGPVDPSPVVIVFLTAITFLAPPTVLSAVTPLVAKLLIHDDAGRAGRVVGNLSAIGTVGALIGTFGTGFVLVAYLPTRRIVLGVGIVLVLLGLATMVRLGIARSAISARSLALVALVGLGAVFAPDPCDTETPYVCVDLQTDPARPGGIAVVLDGVRNSYVDLEDPTYLEFRYFHLIDDVVRARLATTAPTPAEPAEILHVGGAGFTYPSALRAERGNEVDQVVLELDPGLVDLARDELGLVVDDRLQVEIGDARLTIGSLEDDRFDLLVADAFSGYTVPWHLTTRQFTAELDRVLAPDGILVMNLIDGGDLDYLRAQLATLSEVFDHVALLAPPSRDGAGLVGSFPRNYVAVASPAPLPALEIDPADGWLVDGAVTLELIGDARVLDDDFAPVDQLRQY